MKKLSFLLVSLCSLSGVALAVYAECHKPEACDLPKTSIECLTQEENSKCKWKRIDCPGLFTGDYEACLTTGDGNSCSCGEVTRDC